MRTCIYYKHSKEAKDSIKVLMEYIDQNHTEKVRKVKKQVEGVAISGL